MRWAWGILRDSTKVLLEIAPTGLNIDIITRDLKQRFPEIKDLYNRHLWTITAGMIVFSAHVELDNVTDSVTAADLVSQMNDYLADRYGVIESTIQVSGADQAKVCEVA